MQLFQRYFKWIYLFLVLSDIWAATQGLGTLRWVTKPSIVISLLTYVSTYSPYIPRVIYIPFFLALLLCLFGDVFLLMDDRPIFFMLGLGSFLLGHACYTFVFSKNWKKTLPLGILAIFMGLIAYAYFLFQNLEPMLGALKIPVIIYIFFIVLMVISAINRRKDIVPKSYVLVVTGALLFLVSDSILAVDKFLQPVVFSHILIMGTYAAAQYGITDGIIAQYILNKNENKT